MGWAVTWLVDAATYGGNSGGPVFNMKGEVVGVLVGGFGNYENISYCIPVDLFIDDLDNIEKMFIESDYEVVEKLEESYYGGNY
jgi:S1-C subfamily serine protease